MKSWVFRLTSLVLVLSVLSPVAWAQYELGDLVVADVFQGAGIVQRDSPVFTPVYGDFPDGTLGNPGKIDVREGVAYVQSLADIYRFKVVGDTGEFVVGTVGGIGEILFDNQSDELIVCTASDLTWYDVDTGEIVEIVSAGLLAPQDIVQMENGEILIIDTFFGLLKLDNDRNLTVVNDQFSFRSLDQMTLGSDGFLYIAQQQNFPLIDISLYRMDLETGANQEVENLVFDNVFDLVTDFDGRILFCGQRFANEGGAGGVYFYNPKNDVQGTMIEQANFRPVGIKVVDDPGILLGDANQDGEVNLLDIQPFATTIAISQFCVNSDINRDGIVNLLDVEPFIFLLMIQ